MSLSADIMESSLNLVCNTTLFRRSTPCSAALSALYRGSGLVMMEPADFEYGESSMGVTLMREEGESKDWER